MTRYFITNELERQYALFKHEGFLTRCGSVDIRTKEFTEEYLGGIEAIKAFAEKWNGLRNVFMSRDPFTRPNEVAQVTTIGIDIDSKHVKDEAATPSQHAEALYVAGRIVDEYKGGSIASSGNGAYVFWTLDKPIIGAEEITNHYEKLKEWCKTLQSKYPTVIIDRTVCHPKALFKILGTISTKGDSVNRRVAKFTNSCNTPRSEALIKDLSTIRATVPIAALSNGGRGSEYASRSEADYGLVSFLKRRGYGPEAALQALRQNPMGRQTDEKDQKRIIEKIYNEDAGNSGARGSNLGNGLGNQDPGPDYESDLLPPDFDAFIADIANTGRGGVYTGFAELDNQLGPMPKGQLIGLAARSGFGKTSLSLAITEYSRACGKRVLYYSTEYQKRVILKQLAQIAMSIPKAELETIDSLEGSACHKARLYFNELKTNPVYINERSAPTVDMIRHDANKVNPDLIIFDHMNFISTDYHVLAKLSRDLKSLAKELDVTILATAQMNEPDRNMKNGEEFSSVRSDVRGAKDLIQNASLFMYLSRPYMTESHIAPITLHIDKAHLNKRAYFTHDLLIDKRYSKIMEGRHDKSVHSA